MPGWGEGLGGSGVVSAGGSVMWGTSVGADEPPADSSGRARGAHSHSNATGASTTIRSAPPNPGPIAAGATSSAKPTTAAAARTRARLTGSPRRGSGQPREDVGAAVPDEARPGQRVVRGPVFASRHRSSVRGFTSSSSPSCFGDITAGTSSKPRGTEDPSAVGWGSATRLTTPPPQPRHDEPNRSGPYAATGTRRRARPC